MQCPSEDPSVRHREWISARIVAPTDFRTSRCSAESAVSTAARSSSFSDRLRPDSRKTFQPKADGRAAISVHIPCESDARRKIPPLVVHPDCPEIRGRYRRNAAAACCERFVLMPFLHRILVEWMELRSRLTMGSKAPSAGHNSSSVSDSPSRCRRHKAQGLRPLVLLGHWSVANCDTSPVK